MDTLYPHTALRKVDLPEEGLPIMSDTPLLGEAPSVTICTVLSIKERRYHCSPCSGTRQQKAVGYLTLPRVGGFNP
ncbi:hypothetical protein TPADAL_0540a [Treponema pallidum subsp. pallidum DAL-1]|nr:hypothetical protein TPESAMD_0540a [Treponema pallidum subsp. pertenue str. SamoaD]AEZ58733.1 hypothetical protein TPECDC2_0540a [Treponema pallidum subsp. pertenue str. CDC2]AEZ59801.1 hypothetical protein TPEGAU_0540a [Treponema pallidum subsp. pertenue str. Gauthier]AEZ60864.1 hypothetical protein TPADAL_0540a [Treponema pallidum subsp. pallidum DAL-1]AGK84185.1 hypothetical protein TPFB_0540a [Treponema pallidum str. Fribourg-Blanc]AJB40561.1 hypothetical protein TENDBA_0540a [Treponema